MSNQVPRVQITSTVEVYDLVEELVDALSEDEAFDFIAELELRIGSHELMRRLWAYFKDAVEVAVAEGRMEEVGGE